MALRRFPGFVDVHVHMREPGAVGKEDFKTGTEAAVAGGFTYVLDMPNNPIPTVSPARLYEKIRLSRAKAVCDVGFHYGTDGNNLDTFQVVSGNPRVFGLKVYLNHTTGTLLIPDDASLDRIFAAWQSDKPVLVHAEGDRLTYAVDLSEKYGRRLHVCHIATLEDVMMVREAKRRRLRVSVGVTPHHLFLSASDVPRLGAFGLMKPELGSLKDQAALWDGVADGTIDLVESDHAPHTKAEKEDPSPPFGVPGLETTLGLLFGAVRDKRLTEDQLISLLYEKPKEIFSVPDQKDTYTEADPDERYDLGQDGWKTKCGWSPFEGQEVYGKVRKVVIRGRTVFSNGMIV